MMTNFNFHHLTDEEIAQAVGDPLDSVYLEDFRKVLAAFVSKQGEAVPNTEELVLDERTGAPRPLTELEKDAPKLLFALTDAAGYLQSHCTIQTLKQQVKTLLGKHGDFADLHAQAAQEWNLKEMAYDALAAAAARSNWIPEQYAANDWLADCRRWLEFGFEDEQSQNGAKANRSAPAKREFKPNPYGWIGAQAQADLMRFCETCADDEGYDVPKERMQEMAKIGLVRRVSGRIYEITEFGRQVESVLSGEDVVPLNAPSFPVMLRKMWSGTEVQDWIVQNWPHLNALGLIEPADPTLAQASEMGARGGPVVEAERLLFESWMAGHCWAVSGVWNGKTYLGEDESISHVCPHVMRTRQLWAVWRDRAALAKNALDFARKLALGSPTLAETKH